MFIITVIESHTRHSLGILLIFTLLLGRQSKQSWRTDSFKRVCVQTAQEKKMRVEGVTHGLTGLEVTLERLELGLMERGMKRAVNGIYKAQKWR